MTSSTPLPRAGAEPAERPEAQSSAIATALSELGKARAAWSARSDEARDIESFPTRAALE